MVWRSPSRRASPRTGFLEACAGWADPVLVAAEASGALVLAADPLHQERVGLALEVEREGLLLELLGAEVERDPVVEDLLDLLALWLAEGGWILARLDLQDLPHRYMGPFDLRGEHRFLGRQRGEEDRRVGDREEEGVVTSQRLPRLADQRDQPDPIEVGRGKATEVVGDGLRYATASAEGRDSSAALEYPIWRLR